LVKNKKILSDLLEKEKVYRENEGEGDDDSDCSGTNNTGEEGTPSYGLYRYVRPQRVWLIVNRVSILAHFRHFGHK